MDTHCTNCDRLVDEDECYTNTECHIYCSDCWWSSIEADEERDLREMADRDSEEYSDNENDA